VRNARGQRKLEKFVSVRKKDLFKEKKMINEPIFKKSIWEQIEELKKGEEDNKRI